MIDSGSKPVQNSSISRWTGLFFSVQGGLHRWWTAHRRGSQESGEEWQIWESEMGVPEQNQLHHQLSRLLLVHAKSEVSQTQVMAMVIEEPWFSYVFMGFISFHGCLHDVCLHDVSSTAQALRAFHLLAAPRTSRHGRRDARPCCRRFRGDHVWHGLRVDGHRRWGIQAEGRSEDWIGSRLRAGLVFYLWLLAFVGIANFGTWNDLKEVVDVKDPSLMFISDIGCRDGDWMPEDCTGSMGSYIRAAQDNIQSIVSKIGHHGAKVPELWLAGMTSDVLGHWNSEPTTVLFQQLRYHWHMFQYIREYK